MVYNWSVLMVTRVYQEYVDCSNRRAKSIDVGEYKLKVCEEMIHNVEYLDETVPTETFPNTLLQFYTRSNKSN